MPPQTEPPPPGLRLGLRGGRAPPPDPRDGLGLALGERLGEGAGRALGERPDDGAGRAPDGRPDGAGRVDGALEEGEGRERAAGGRAPEPPDGLACGSGARRVTLGRALRSVRTGPVDGAARSGRLGVARALGRLWGAEGARADGRGSVRTLGCGRADPRWSAEGVERGVTLGRRSFPALGATLADGRSWLDGATLAEGRSCVLGVARADGRDCALGATRADGRS